MNRLTETIRDMNEVLGEDMSRAVRRGVYITAREMSMKGRGDEQRMRTLERGFYKSELAHTLGQIIKHKYFNYLVVVQL
jgi:hypothetical protein